MVLHMNAHIINLFIFIKYILFSLQMEILFLASGWSAGITSRTGHLEQVRVKYVAQGLLEY